MMPEDIDDPARPLGLGDTVRIEYPCSIFSKANVDSIDPDFTSVPGFTYQPERPTEGKIIRDDSSATPLVQPIDGTPTGPQFIHRDYLTRVP